MSMINNSNGVVWAEKDLPDEFRALFCSCLDPWAVDKNYLVLTSTNDQQDQGLIYYDTVPTILQ